MLPGTSQKQVRLGQGCSRQELCRQVVGWCWEWGSHLHQQPPTQLKSCPPVCACVSPAQRHEGTSPQRVWETQMQSWVKLAAQCLADRAGLSGATYKLKSNEDKLFLIGGW